MIRILDNNKMGIGTRMYETPYNYYIDNIEYDKKEMYHTPFKCFNDNNPLQFNNIAFNKMISPYLNQYYYNGFKNGNVLVDNQDENIVYISHLDKSEGDYSYNRKARIGIINKKTKNVKIISTHRSSSSSYYTYNRNPIKFLSQTETHIYMVIAGSNERTSSSYTSSPDGFHNRGNSYGCLETTIVAIEKKTLQETRTQDIYQYKIIASFPRSYGDVKIIKETDTDIYCLISMFDDNGNQYEIFKIDKTNQNYNSGSYSSIQKFYQDFDSNQRSDIVTPSEITKLDEDNYEFYLTLMEKGEQVSGQNYYHHKYYLYKCKFTISTTTLEKTKMTINEDDLPYFGCWVGCYYNEIYHFKNNGNDYLVTSTNVFYKGNKKYDLEDKIISYYKIDNSGDTPQCTLLDTIVTKNISGDFYGMLFNEEDKMFFAITSQTSYIFDFSSERIKVIDLKNKPKEIGIDLQGNYFASNDDSSVYIYGKNKVSTIELTPPDIPDKINYPHNANIKMSAFNFNGERIELPVRLTIVGDNATFDDNSSNILIKNSEIDSDVSIPITITNDSIFEVYAEVERDEVI